MAEGSEDVGPPDGGSRCLLDPVPEVFEAAGLLREAAIAHRDGDRGLPARLFRAADMDAVRRWTETVWGRDGPARRRRRVVPGAPLRLPAALREPGRAPTAAVRARLVGHFGHRCAFCGIPLVPTVVRRRAARLYPDAVPWGRGNTSQHAAFQAMWLQFDHVRPHTRGGDSSFENLVVTCAPCNYGRMEHTLEEVGLADPRLRPVEPTAWDGLVWFC